MSYWFRISFSSLDLVKKKHIDFQNELADCYPETSPSDLVLLVRRPDHSEYFFQSDRSIPKCLQLLLNNWAKRSDPPREPLVLVFGDEEKFDELRIAS